MKSLMFAVFSLVLATSFAEAAVLNCSKENLQIRYNVKEAQAIFDLEAKAFSGKIKSKEYGHFLFKMNGWIKDGIEMDSAQLIIPTDIKENDKGTITVISFYEGVNFADDYECVVVK